MAVKERDCSWLAARGLPRPAELRRCVEITDRKVVPDQFRTLLVYYLSSQRGRYVQLLLYNGGQRKVERNSGELGYPGLCLHWPVALIPLDEFCLYARLESEAVRGEIISSWCRPYDWEPLG